MLRASLRLTQYRHNVAQRLRGLRNEIVALELLLAVPTDLAANEDLPEDARLLINTMLEWRQLTKLKSTYVDALPTMINQDRTEALQPAIDRVWGAALTLILIVFLLNLLGRFVGRFSKVS